MSSRTFSLKYPMSLKNKNRFENNEAMIAWVQEYLFDFIAQRLVKGFEENKTPFLQNSYRHDVMMGLLKDLSDSLDIIDLNEQSIWQFSVSLEFPMDLPYLSAVMDMVVEICHKRAYSKVGNNPPPEGDEVIFSEITELLAPFWPHEFSFGETMNLTIQEVRGKGDA